MSQPRISIITACYNARATISETLSSVIGQRYPNTELIVIDGGSTDGTVDVIKSFGGAIHKLISESDRGLADAWNKGLSYATGDIIGLLNADDYYASDTFQSVVEAFGAWSEPVIGYGNVTLVDEGRVRATIVGRQKRRIGLVNGFGFMHPSVVFTRDVLAINGLFDTKRRVAVDTDWLLRAVMNRIAFRKIPSHTYMRCGGMSMSSPYTGMGEYLDSLVKYKYPGYYVPLFLLLRSFGAARRMLLGAGTK